MSTLVAFSDYDLISALRYGSFQAVSIMTTTGYSSTDFGQWSYFGQYFLLMLMFIGGCAGSTAGGIKTVTFTVVVLIAYATLRKRREVEAKISCWTEGNSCYNASNEWKT